ncbi:hypothetical protein KUTeg_006270 [Tegillarca granosa]|uniref:UBA domain-containing protein n=1 Tax=Tegillarca granosa TaxID=220873 RepID=A0ABQ9FJA7_TEGGR|nr:hypothetical protein KUTeg_006270 [Tegillarca granosa]
MLKSKINQARHLISWNSCSSYVSHIIMSHSLSCCFFFTECENIIKQMLTVDPNKRITMNEIINHKWMKLSGDDSDFDNLICDYNRPSDVEDDELNEQILSHIESLGLDSERSIKSVKENTFDAHSAVYHLLMDKWKKHPKTIINKLPVMLLSRNIPITTRTERRSSITTGVVERVEVPQDNKPCIPQTTIGATIPQVQFFNENNELTEPDEGSQHSDSDSEEPSPEALARYLAMRRHTVGVGDSRHEVPEDVRVKLANHQPIIAMPQPNLFMPFGFLPHMNLPQTLPPIQNETVQNVPAKGQQFLQLPQLFGSGRSSYDKFDLNITQNMKYRSDAYNTPLAKDKIISLIQAQCILTNL